MTTRKIKNNTVYAGELAYLKAVSDWMHEADIHEVTVESEDRSVHIVRRGQVPAAAPLAATAPVAAATTPVAQLAVAETPIAQAETTGGHLELAPMVGVAYLAPSPNDDNFVTIGQTVRVGDPLLIIEAMKVMNQIQATKAGIVKEVLVSDGAPVEFDQALVRIE